MFAGQDMALIGDAVQARRGRAMPAAVGIRRASIWLVALLTLGSGALNVYSVLGRGLPERIEFLRKFFPLEVIHVSRSATLLIGLALIVSSINIYRRKRRAYWTVAALAAFSVVFHFAKGFDYEEAILSLALLGMLASTREQFTVRSRRVDWTAALQAVAVVAVVALTYGVAGFWFLEPRDFGINFNLRQSLHHTLEFVTLQGDPALTPRTHFAEWFLDSLSLMTVIVAASALIAFFRPVLYRFRTHPLEVERATRILERHGTLSQGFFKARPDKSFYFTEDGRAFVAYRVSNSVAVALGDPSGPPGAVEQAAREFARYCEDNGWSVVFYQTAAQFVDLYRSIGLKKLKIGDDAIVDLTRFTLEGRAAKALRSKVNQLEAAGVRTRYYPAPVPEHVMAAVREVSDEWLQIPGRRERQFTLGMFDEEYVKSTPVFTAEDASGQVLAFVNVVPSYRTGEATIDLMRRRSEAPNGVMDYLFVKLFLQCRGSGYQTFNLGMAPMAGFQSHEEASPEERALHAFFQHLNFLFSFKGLLAYKAKFASAWEPRFLIYRNILDLPRVAMAISSVSEVRDE